MIPSAYANDEVCLHLLFFCCVLYFAQEKRRMKMEILQFLLLKSDFFFFFWKLEKYKHWIFEKISFTILDNLIQQSKYFQGNINEIS